MSGANQLAWGLFMGAVAMATVNLAIGDWKARAVANEAQACKDKGDTKAYMARLPGEAHSVEACVYFKRFGDPKWVPELGDVTVTGQGVPGRPGLEQQLTYVRAECRRLAKQLKQRC